LGGAFVETEEGFFRVLAEKDRILLVEFNWYHPPIGWFGSFELMYCERQHDASTIKVIRKATDDERKAFRVPLWIQDEEIPECCGRAMHFVGQIDDDRICTEPPPDAKYWWHDTASFYVFTCSQCLAVKAVGQQF
jgi:hypothetical protein